MRVFVSNVSDELKTSYRNLVYLMLDRIRFGTDTTEYEYLQQNAPEAVTGNTSKINYILYKTMEFVGFNEQKIEDEKQDNIPDNTLIKPMTFWYGFYFVIWR